MQKSQLSICACYVPITPNDFKVSPKGSKDTLPESFVVEDTKDELTSPKSNTFPLNTSSTKLKKSKTSSTSSLSSSNSSMRDSSMYLSQKVCTFRYFISKSGCRSIDKSFKVHCFIGNKTKLDDSFTEEVEDEDLGTFLLSVLPYSLQHQLWVKMKKERKKRKKTLRL